jgi:hypothetical protein
VRRLDAWRKFKHCFSHFQAESPAQQLEQKRAALAELQKLPAKEQPKATMCSLENKIRALEQAVEPPEEPEVQPEPSLERSELCVDSLDAGLDTGSSEELEMQPEPSSAASEPVDTGLDAGPDDGPPVARELARQLRKEVETGKSMKGRPLSQDEIRLKHAKLQRRVLVLLSRCWPALKEKSSPGGPTNQIDQALVSSRLLRGERKALVQEQRVERAAAQEAKRRKVAPHPRGFWPVASFGLDNCLGRPAFQLEVLWKQPKELLQSPDTYQLLPHHGLWEAGHTAELDASGLHRHGSPAHEAAQCLSIGLQCFFLARIACWAPTLESPRKLHVDGNGLLDRKRLADRHASTSRRHHMGSHELLDLVDFGRIPRLICPRSNALGHQGSESAGFLEAFDTLHVYLVVLSFLVARIALQCVDQLLIASHHVLWGNPMIALWEFEF